VVDLGPCSVGRVEARELCDPPALYLDRSGERRWFASYLLVRTWRYRLKLGAAR